MDRYICERSGTWRTLYLWHGFRKVVRQASDDDDDEAHQSTLDIEYELRMSGTSGFSTKVNGA